MSVTRRVIRGLVVFALAPLLLGGGAPRQAAPAQRADRFGIYNWNVNDAAFPNDGSTDRLNWGANRVAELGSRTIRVALSTRDDYRVNPPGATDLVEIAKSPAYDKLFRDARFQTILLTVYSAGATAGNWTDGFTAAEAATERDEMRRLTEYLLGNAALTGKTFLLLNWEGDNAIFYHNNKQSIWDAYLAWAQARVEGVRLGRQSLPASAVRVYSGLEFNQVRHPITRNPCGAPVADPVNQDPLQNRCVIDYVAPRVDADFYSYSSWDTVNRKQDEPALSLRQIFKEDLGFALDKVRAARPGVTEQNFLVGEYGFERTRYGECYAANDLNEMFDAFDGADAFHAAYAVFWQIIDNNRALGSLDERFGLFRVRNGAIGATMLSDVFQKRVAGQTPPASAGCPRIRRAPEPPGVLTPTGTQDFTLNPDPVLSIYVPNCCQSTDAPFSASGNTVSLNQLSSYFRLPADNPTFWYESPTQINFSLPAARRPGPGWVYVTDARGTESNAQPIELSCAGCPAINESCGVLDAKYQTMGIEPGVAVTIEGARFSSEGNAVAIEQLNGKGGMRKWIVPREDVIAESVSRITVRLPGDLTTGAEALVHVENNLGLASNDVVISIGTPCPTCGPRLKPCGGIVNEAAGDFAANTVAAVFGRFGAPGNRVVVEQFDRTGKLYRQTLSQGAPGWDESAQRIRFALPASLFPGRALVYVADATGRETRAQAITIRATPVASVSAADFKGPALAPESIAAAFGIALATDAQAAAATPLPTDLLGTRVLLKDSAGVERTAPLFFVSPAQVNFQIPAGTSTGTGQLTILNGYGSSSAGPVQIARVQPALFAANANGRGVPAGVALRVKADGAQVFEPIAALDAKGAALVPLPIDLGPANEQVFLILFGTGVRGRSALPNVAASIGGAAADVGFAGPHPSLVGLDQINLRLPRSLAGRGEIDLTVTVDGVTTFPLRINVK